MSDNQIIAKDLSSKKEKFISDYQSREEFITEISIENPNLSISIDSCVIRSNAAISKSHFSSNSVYLKKCEIGTSAENDINNKNIKTNLSLLDKILVEYGYRYQIIKVIIGSILLSFLSSYMIYHVSCFLLVIKKEFELNDEMLTLLACIGFFFKSMGCLLTGYQTNVISRRSLLLIDILILLVLNIGLTLIWNIWAYFVFLILGCFIAGNIDPINIDVLCESLPIKFRGFFLCFSYTGFPLNIFLQYFLINFFSEADNTQIKNILHLNSLVILLIFILMLVFFKDSIRHQLIKEKYETAFEMLNKLIKNPLSNEEKELIKIQCKNGNKEIQNASIKEIFSPLYLATTLLFICLNFSYNSMTDGMSFVLNLILSDFIQNFDEKKISHEGMKLYLVGLFAYAVCGILTEIPFIKRKFGLFITSAMILNFSVLFFLNAENYFWWLAFLLFFCNASTSLSISFVSESYPTKIRDVSQGFMNSVANIGSLAGQLIFMNLYHISKANTTLIYTMINSFICIFLILLIKKEMYSKPLDFCDGFEIKDENEGLIAEKVNDKVIV